MSGHGNIQIMQTTGAHNNTAGGGTTKNSKKKSSSIDKKGIMVSANNSNIAEYTRKGTNTQSKSTLILNSIFKAHL